MEEALYKHEGKSIDIIAGSNGKAVRFQEAALRPLGRSARGVKGFNTDGGHVIGMATDSEGTYTVTVDIGSTVIVPVTANTVSLLEYYRAGRRANITVFTVGSRSHHLNKRLSARKHLYFCGNFGCCTVTVFTEIRDR